MRIGQRLLLGLATVFVGAGVLAAVLFYAMETSHERRKLEVVGRMIADQVFVRIGARMRTHRGALGPDLLAELALPPMVRRVLIVNAAGRVRISNDPAFAGRTLSRRDEGCRQCHGRPAAPSVELGPFLRSALPLTASGTCVECHRSAGAALGCLIVDLDLTDYRAEVAKEIGAGLALLGVLFAAAGGGTLVFARRWITRRLDALGAVMQRFEGGELTARSGVSGRDEIARLEGGFNRMAQSLQSRESERGALLAQLNASNEELRRGEELLRRSLDTQRVLNDVMRMSLGEQPLDAVLQRSLELVLGIPWLTVEARGSVFVAEGETLVLRAHKGLDPRLLDACARVPFGHCLCGRAAAQARVVHAANVDDEHDTRYPGMGEHGHYCVPILSSGRVLGVLNLYLGAGQAESATETEFLVAVANTLAGIIWRSAAERRLRASEQRFRTLAEAASDTIFILDRDRRVVFVNGTGARLFGVTPEELIGKGIAELFPPAAIERMGGSIAQVLETGQALYREDLLPFPTGEVWLGTTLVALPDAAGVFGISRDITGQRHAQAERERLIADLQELLQVVSHSHQEWQSTFDGITDMISILDADNRIVKVNRAYAEYFGAHPRDLIGRACDAFCLAGHAGAGACPMIREAGSGGVVTEEVPDPRTGRVFRVSIFPYAAGGGGVDRFVHLAEDVTVEREREQRLIMSERLAALGQMASGIAHEINNPLASIAGCSEALLGRLEQGRLDPAVFREYLGIVHEEVFRCKKITTAMLSFVRRGGSESAAVLPQEALERALELVGFQGRLRSVEVVREYLDGLPAVRVSEGEIRQVLLIVLTNALDAMRDSGTLRCGAVVTDCGVTVTITDSGAGLSPEALQKIFTPFFTTKADHGGTGLGLSIARRIVEDHGGSIRIEPHPEGGTTVSITFPAA